MKALLCIGMPHAFIVAYSMTSSVEARQTAVFVYGAVIDAGYSVYTEPICEQNSALKMPRSFCASCLHCYVAASYDRHLHHWAEGKWHRDLLDLQGIESFLTWRIFSLELWIKKRWFHLICCNVIYSTKNVKDLINCHHKYLWWKLFLVHLSVLVIFDWLWWCRTELWIQTNLRSVENRKSFDL